MPFSRSRSLESIILSSRCSRVGGERTRLLQHGVDQSGLAMVDVSDDGDVTDVVARGHA